MGLRSGNSWRRGIRSRVPALFSHHPFAMSRLHTELQRLYLVPPADDTASPGLVGADARVRALVLELARPASWEALSALWEGVQRDLELPAPAIAVSGTDALQLWFSLAEPVTVGEAQGFLSAVRVRFLPDVVAKRLRLWPTADGSASAPRHVPLVPAEQPEAGLWSAFVKPDLAPVFADTPWLDIPPNADGQADLLSRLTSMSPSAFAAALQRLTPAASEAGDQPARASLDPRRFLLQVMSDETVPLAQRIDAAKALLPYTERPARP